jgi:diketogulonate reductase-like aldo/keto reductase
MCKLWNSDHGHVLEACKDSLKKLRLYYLDLYLVHFPIATRHTGNITSFALFACYIQFFLT